MERKTIKDYANQLGWSDTTPYEVVKVISETTVEVRRMHSDLITPAKCLGVGGFAGNFDNSTQEWKITPIEEMPTERIRWSAAKNVWQNKHGSRFMMSDIPVRYYDYNF